MSTLDCLLKGIQFFIRHSVSTRNKAIVKNKLLRTLYQTLQLKRSMKLLKNYLTFVFFAKQEIIFHTICEHSLMMTSKGQEILGERYCSAAIVFLLPYLSTLEKVNE